MSRTISSKSPSTSTTHSPTIKNKTLTKNRGLMKDVKKQHLPSKTCLVCGRPFTWRKKWEKVWEEVKYCSERCRRNKPAL
jgi:hypothetical protein